MKEKRGKNWKNWNKSQNKVDVAEKIEIVKNLVRKKWMMTWVSKTMFLGGWVDEWVEVKNIIRNAYSNQKGYLLLANFKCSTENWYDN